MIVDGGIIRDPEGKEKIVMYIVPKELYILDPNESAFEIKERSNPLKFKKHKKHHAKNNKQYF